MKTRFLTLFVALVCATQVFAQDFLVNNILYSHLGGDSVAVTHYDRYPGYYYRPYNDNSLNSRKYSGDLTIPSTVIYDGITYRVVSIDAQTFYGCSDLTSITIPESITSIGYEAFYNCTGLTSVTIGNGVTSIGYSAFRKCSSLTAPVYNAHVFAYLHSLHSGAYSIPEGITTIAAGAFFGCDLLTSVTIPNSITTIDETAFLYCNGLTSIAWNAKHCADFSSSSTPFYSSDLRANITSITFGDEVEHIPAYLCYGFSNLTSLTIPNNVTSIGTNAFYNCSSLASVTWNATHCADFTSASPFNKLSSIKSFAFSNEVEYIPAYVCYGCTGLTDVTIGNGVTAVGSQAFNNCTSLTKTNYTGDVASWCAIDFEDFSANPIYYSHNLYINDIEVKDLVIPNGVEDIKSYAFYTCTGLTSVTIPESLISIGSDTFYGCSGLTAITWNAKHVADFSSSSISPFYNVRSQITSVTFGENVEYIPAYLCYNFNALPTIAIPNSVKEIGSYAFRGCAKATNISLGNKITTIGMHTFADCSNLESITLPSSVISIGENAFANSDKLGYTTEGNAKYLGNPRNKYHALIKATQTSITSCNIHQNTGIVADGAFRNCNKLLSIDIPNQVTHIGYAAFHSCTKLAAATIQEGVTTIGQEAFYACDSLRSVSIPNSVTTIGSSTFYNCYRLESITIPNSITTIGQEAFAGCADLTSITIPDSVTTVGQKAFYNCSDLTSISISNSMSTLEESIFANCVGLTSLTIPANITHIADKAFGGCVNIESVQLKSPTPPYLGDGALHTNMLVTVPCGCTENYQNSDTRWKDFGYYEEVLENTLTAMSSNEEYGKVTITQLPTCDTPTAIFEAVPNAGYEFVAWNDSNTDNPRTIEVSSDTTFTATFAAILVNDIILDKDTIALLAGDSQQLNATVLPDAALNKTILWSTNNGNVATVTNGLVTAVGNGTATITAKTEDGGFTATCEVVVTTAVKGVSLDKRYFELLIGTSEQLTATTTPITATNQTILWSTSDEKVATVVDGLVTAISNGTATITATTEEGGFTATCRVTVTTPVASISLDKTAVDLLFGQSEYLTATIAPESATNKTIIWKTSNASVATVANGVVTAVGNGTATITAKTEDGGYTATCEVTVTTPVESISLNKTFLDLPTGTTEQLTATIAPATANNQNYTWSTSDESVATVVNGLVTAIADGTANIIVTTEDGGLKDTCVVTVTTPVSGITLNATSLDLFVGTTEQLIATISPESATNKAIIWSSDDVTVASVEEGLVTALAKGQTTITATTEDGSYMATCAVTVTAETALDNVSANDTSHVQKVFENGTIYILRNGEKYTIDGRKVE